MAWASFHVIEVMSSPKIEYKRIGYRAAAASFRQDTDVLMLCTNLIKKDLASNNYLEAAAALNGLAQIVTPDLGRDLSPDLYAMLNHSRPYIRKKVILVLYKVFLKYPEALRMAFPRLKEKLSDPDPSVVSAAVNVICELARKNPKSYLPLAPQLYGLLTNSSNNWMLIKIIKLFAALTPLEPRLVKKLVQPITNLIQNTPAMSLLYECIQTVIVGGMISPETENGENEAHDSALARLCVSKLKLFVEEPDQNLKYLGLLALSKLLAVRPKAVAEHKDMVLQCLDDADVSIRMRALDLISGLVTQRNLVEVIRRLMSQLIPPKEEKSPVVSSPYPPSTLQGPAGDPVYRSEVISRTVSICSRDTYADVVNFEWYINVLLDLVYVTGVSVGEMLAGQLVDVAVRVKNVREYAVKAMVKLLSDRTLLNSARQERNNSGVLYAAAWIVGEYVSFVPSPSEVLILLLQAPALRLSPTIQSVYVQNVLKVYASWANSDEVRSSSGEQFYTITKMVLEGLERFTTSSDLEVQERASSAVEILKLIPARAETIVGEAQLVVPSAEGYQEINGGPVSEEKGSPFDLPAVVTELPCLFVGELNPVAAKAQKKVPVPEGLDLDKWIHEPEAEPVEEEDDDFADMDHRFSNGEGSRRIIVEDPIEVARRKKERVERRKHDPFYIPSHASGSEYGDFNDDVDDIPIVQLSIDGSLPPLNAGSKSSPKTQSKKGRKQKHTVARELSPPPPPPPSVPYEINRDSEMPEGAGDALQDSDLEEEERKRRELDPETYAVLSVDLTKNPEDDVPIVAAPVSLPKLELGVARKKVKGKGPVEGGSGGERKMKKKKKKTEEGGEEENEGKKKAKGSEVGAKQNKKKKGNPEDGLNVKPKKTKAKRVAAIAGVPPQTAASVDTAQGQLEIPRPSSAIGASGGAYERLPSPAPVGSVLEISSSGAQASRAVEHPTSVVVADDGGVSVSCDWSISDEGTSPTLRVEVSLSISNNRAAPLARASVHLTPSSPILISSAAGDEQPFVISGPIDCGTTTTIRLNAKVPMADAETLVPAKTLEGVLQYEGAEERSLPLVISLPATINLLPASMIEIDPSSFANLLSDSTNFPFSASTQFLVPPSSISDDTRMATILSLAARSRLCVVEVVEGSASIFGKSRQGLYVAGLMKIRSKPRAGGKSGATMSVELKSGDRSLIEAIVEEINDWASDL
ncbi:AP-3 complex subunit delta-1 [Borealophlyctis nickersoniae]|nr:AP-3 complex subunit delta-1 [Borealophlyctis nickersoniae]